MKSISGTTQRSSPEESDPVADMMETVPCKLKESSDDMEEILDLTAATALRSLSTSATLLSEHKNENEKEFTIPQRFTRSGRKRAASFPLKLMKVLSMKEFSEIISWTPSGKSFHILNSKRFVAEILPHFFKSAKYSSFTRKLHRWGFVRHYRGKEAGAFYHKYFQKGAGDLVEKMTCYKQEPPKVASPPLCTPPNQKILVSSTLKSDALLGQRTKLHLSIANEQQSPVCHRHLSLPRQAPMHILSQGSPDQLTVAPTSAEINVAIEIEVARRLQERIKVAALQRRALELLRQEQQQSQISSHLAHSQQQRNWSQPGSGFSKNTFCPLPLALPQGAYKPFENPLLAQRSQATDTQHLPSLSYTNIQRAKTA